jgi:ABC-type nitrate/sulfonate/bicarbonate transport system substrate-binding protein
MKKNAVARVLLTCLLALTCAESSNAQTSPSPSADLKTVNLALYGTTLGDWCVYAAESQNYFTKAGIRIGNKLFLSGDPAIVSAITSGQADIASGGTASIIPVANGQTDQIVIIGGVEGSPVSLISPNNITAPAQLAGKTIALPAHNTSNEAIGTALVNTYVGKGKWTPLYIGGASTGRLAAVTAGQATAAYINDPSDLAEVPELHTLTHFGASQHLYGNGGVLSTRKWLHDNPDAAMRFMAAFAKGCNYVIDLKNRATAIDLLVKGGPLSVRSATSAYDYYVAGPFRGNTPPANAKLDIQAFGNSVQLLKDGGQITNPAFDYHSVIDLSFLDKALKSPMFLSK